jgi:Chromo (CHRromatin Organisation MOdifier) domain
LNIPEGSKAHFVFHVAQLKEKIGTDITVVPKLPIMGRQVKEKSEPIVVLDRRIVKGKNEPVAQLLIRWSHLPDSNATWENYLDLK